MFAFWNTITEPILEILRPEVVVEVGSESGSNTRKLLEFCEGHGATLHAVDPAPNFDVAGLRERYGDHLVFHEALSLDALARIDRFDVVLLDGDHNWYTVYNELKLIEKGCERSSRPFPLVMLHDIDWPYGRRDLYYNPETIPEEYRQPHETRGMKPGHPELVEAGGMNPGVSNATSEGGPRNGVLTGIEDFLEESDHGLTFTRLHGLHGLGILTPPALEEQNPKLANFLALLRFHPTVAGHVERLEEERIGLVLARSERVSELKEVRNTLREVMSHRERLQEQNDGLRERLATQNEGLRSRQREARSTLEKVMSQRKKLRERNKKLAYQNRELAQELQEMQDTKAWRLVTTVKNLRNRLTRI